MYGIFKIAFTIVLMLALASCAAGRAELHDIYQQCLANNQMVSVGSTGVVELDPKTREPVMVTDQAACKAESDAWLSAEESFERRMDRETTLSCAAGRILVCKGRGVGGCNRKSIERGMCDCGCYDRVPWGRPSW